MPWPAIYTLDFSRLPRVITIKVFVVAFSRSIALRLEEIVLALQPVISVFAIGKHFFGRMLLLGRLRYGGGWEPRGGLILGGAGTGDKAG